MNFIDICIITLAVSFFMRIKAKLDIYKEISTLGYKFNHEKLSELKKDKNNKLYIITNVLDDYYMYIPFYNLLIDMTRDTNYYEHKEEQIEMLKNYGALEEMTDDEKKEYNEYKMAYYAIKMDNNRIKKRESASIIELSDGNKIWFNINEDKEDDNLSIIDLIEIVEVTGTYKNLSIEQLKQKVYSSLILYGDEMIKNEKEEEGYLEDNKKIGIESNTNNQNNDINSKPKIKIRKKGK